MADRTSAAIFAEMFEYLAGQKQISKKAFVEKLWEDTRFYDFSPCQMDIDEILVEFGLAVECSCSCMAYKGQGIDIHQDPSCNADDWSEGFARQD